ncbi:TIGR02444 family protein [Aquibium microcysteis]|uniref:TIGR02444 family protein n=1 Tax=Aquibium microcysteis TaxID=675281 RepID=UPI00165D2148|nr:TIGR02444 family protein [Aquibium microcysteis]
MTSADSPPTLWDFSVDLYGRPGVSRACLVLQDNLGVDVNLLLFCVWWSTTGRGDIGEEAFATIVQRATRWNHDVVRPLRTARKAVKRGHPSLPATEAEALYRTVLDAELLMERAEQTILERTAEELLGQDSSTSRAGDASPRLIERYLAKLGAVPDRQDQQALATILSFAGGRAPAPAPHRDA